MTEKLQGLINNENAIEVEINVYAPVETVEKVLNGEITTDYWLRKIER